MRVRDLGTRPAPAAIRELISRPVRGRGPAETVQRRQVPYWQEQGWVREGNEYSGNYRTPFGAFAGWIQDRGGTDIDFFIYAPPQVLQEDSHWTCFQARGDEGWYLVHMGRRPQDVSSGILSIERLITAASRRQRR